MEVSQIAKRLNDHLSSISRRFPKAWTQIDELRGAKGKSLPDWSDWCFMPIAGTLVVVQNHGIPLGPEIATWPAKLAALGAWRYTKGIYHFDPVVFEALWDTPLEKIPSEILFQIPEWCLYLATPGRMFLEKPLFGVFVHLEHDANTGRPELRFLFDVDTDTKPFLVPGQLHLNYATLDESIEAAARNTRQNGIQHGVPEPLLNESIKMYQSVREITEPILSLLLYICSQNAEIRDLIGKNQKPQFPQPVKTKRGNRLFAADRTVNWECGWRTGSALRTGLESEKAEGGDSRDRNRPRPHIRRAHWHHFRVGPRTDSRLAVRWLPPIPVNVNSAENLIPTKHQVS